MTTTTLDPHAFLNGLNMNFQGVILPRPDFYIPIKEETTETETSYSPDNSSSTFDGKQKGFDDIKTRLINLLHLEEEEDFTYAPSVHAVALVSKIVKIAYLLSNGDPVRPLIGADGQGGLKFDWRAEDKEVRLFIPATAARTPYLYFRSEDGDGIIDSPTGSALAEWLTWLNN